MENNNKQETTMNSTATYYIEIAERLTYRQLQQLCKQARDMGYITKKGFRLNQKRSALVLRAASIYMSLDLAKAS